MKKKSIKNSALLDMFPHYKANDLFPFPEDVHDPIPLPNHDYQTFAISVFDHKLNEAEYESKMITFSTFNKVPIRPCELWDLYKSYEDKFYNFYKSLYGSGVYMIFKDNYLVEFDGLQEYRRYCMYDIREQNRWHTYMCPALGVLISGNFDLTHIVHTSKKYYKKDEFEKIVKDSGLYILR